MYGEHALVHKGQGRYAAEPIITNSLPLFTHQCRERFAFVLTELCSGIRQEPPDEFLVTHLPVSQVRSLRHRVQAAHHVSERV